MPDWDKLGKSGKQGFDAVWGWADKLGAPVNQLTNKIGSEAFWPTTLDKESDKAARILKSFCKDGFFAEDERPTEEARNIEKYSKTRVLQKIPVEVIKKAKGLAIFTVMRSGLWISGAGGSGVLLGRMENGEWSPPSGILIHTMAGGLVFGADIYDCVVVINSEKALEAFRTVRATLGGELSAVAGPVGVGAVIDMEVHGKTPPVFTYMKSRGFYAGLGANGSLIIERKDENARFYLQPEIRAREILAGQTKHVPSQEIEMLMTTIRSAQGDINIDQNLLPANAPTPGDLELERMGETHFGLPTADDPDPFGFRALEEEGLEIREAGTGIKPTTEMLEYKPALSSPAYNLLHRKSVSPRMRSTSWSRDSSQPRHKMSNPKMVYYVDESTQTMTSEERQEEMEQEAIRLADYDEEEIEEGVIQEATVRRMPPPLPIRAPAPALPPRSPRPVSTLSEITSPTIVIDEHDDHKKEGYFAMTGNESDSPEHSAPMHDVEPSPIESEHGAPDLKYVNTRLSATEITNHEQQPQTAFDDSEPVSARSEDAVKSGPYPGHVHNEEAELQDVDINSNTANGITEISPVERKEAVPVPGAFT